MNLHRTRELWELYARDGNLTSLASLRTEIAESWGRCRQLQVPIRIDCLRRVTLDEVEERRGWQPELAESALPYLHKLYRIIEDDESVITLSDRDGVVLEAISGDTMKGMPNFPEIGTIHSEEDVGTNGIGTCLAAGEALQLHGPEHWLEINHSWVCSTSPVFVNNCLVGCVNLSCPTVGKHHEHTLGLVIATANAIEREIMLNSVLNERRIVLSQQEAILKIVDTGIIAIDKNGTISTINQQAMDAFSVSSSWVGKSIDDLIQTQSAFTELIGGRDELDDFELPVRINGRYRHLLFSTFRIDQDKIGIGTIIRVRTAGSVRRIVNRASGSRASYTFEDILTRSPKMEQPLKLAQLAGRSQSNVLISGESGTGKELIAQSIHNASDRRDQPFVALNCGTLSRELIQSELFGYEAGAFTGAKSNGNPGKFELADGGTLFLDEIGELPLELQVNLLRVLQTGEVMRIGAKHPIGVDVRIIAATNRNLLNSIEEFSFRDDLYYRLNVLAVSLPPLRERDDDVQLLADFFLRRAVEKNNRPNIVLSEEVRLAISAYPWPGNIRELENTLERAVLLCEGSVIDLAVMPQDITSPCTKRSLHPLHPQSAGQKILSREEAERERLLAGLRETRGNLRRTALFLGVSRGTVYNMLKKHGVNAADYR